MSLLCDAIVLILHTLFIYSWLFCNSCTESYCTNYVGKVALQRVSKIRSADRRHKDVTYSHKHGARNFLADLPQYN
jgi:hypothetical protein